MRQSSSQRHSIYSICNIILSETRFCHFFFANKYTQIWHGPRKKPTIYSYRHAHISFHTNYPFGLDSLQCIESIFDDPLNYDFSSDESFSERNALPERNLFFEKKAKCLLKTFCNFFRGAQRVFFTLIRIVEGFRFVRETEFARIFKNNIKLSCK